LYLLRQSQRIPDGWLTAREISIPDYKSTTQVKFRVPRFFKDDAAAAAAAAQR
jgi:hypothetical protein